MWLIKSFLSSINYYKNIIRCKTLTFAKKRINKKVIQDFIKMNHLLIMWNKTQVYVINLIVKNIIVYLNV